MLTPARLARALMSLKRVTIHGPWTRVVRFHHLLGPPPVLRERIRLNRYGGEAPSSMALGLHQRGVFLLSIWHVIRSQR